MRNTVQTDSVKWGLLGYMLLHVFQICCFP